MKLLLALIAVFGAAGTLASADPPERPARLEDIRRGMTMAEVKQVLQSPKHVTREVLFRRFIEEWHYDEPACWIEFNCVRGELAYVQNVHAELNGR